MKVLIVQRIFSFYREPIFDLLDANYDLKVLHGKNTSGIKQLKKRYSRIVKHFSYGNKETNVFLFVFWKILQIKPDIIIHEQSLGCISIFPTLWLAKLLRIKFILWGHGYDMTKGFNPKGSLQDKLRVYLLKRADAVLLYNNQAKEVIKGVISEKKIFIAWNTLNTPHLKKIRDNYINKSNKEWYENDLNLIYVGRLIKRKNPYFLIDLMEYFKINSEYNIRLQIIGDGDEMNKMKELTYDKGLNDNIIFHGGIYDDDSLGRLLIQSDLLVNPGYLGLSIIHAFAFDCPVITVKQGKNGPFHSPEIEYLEHLNNGLLVEESDIAQFYKEMVKLIEDRTMLNNLKKNAFHTAYYHASLENMYKGFENSINWLYPIKKNY